LVANDPMRALLAPQKPPPADTRAQLERNYKVAQLKATNEELGSL